LVVSTSSAEGGGKCVLSFLVVSTSSAEGGGKCVLPLRNDGRKGNAKALTFYPSIISYAEMQEAESRVQIAGV